MNKLRRVSVETPNGTRYIMYRPIGEIPTDSLICDTKCPYGEVCGKLPDPRFPDDKSYCYIDFCQSLGEGEDKKSSDLSSMVPAEGELENLFKDNKPILKTILDTDPIVRLKKVVDCCCPEMCDLYKKDHSECSLENRMCFFRPYFINVRGGSIDDVLEENQD